MNKFLLLYTAPTETREKMQSATPEEMKEGMGEWIGWFEKVGGNMVDKGLPLSNAMTVTKDDLLPGNVEFVAYTIIQAESLDGATAIAKQSPHLNREGSTVEVHEMVPIPEM